MITIINKVDTDFDEPISVAGLYNLAEAAIDMNEPIVMFGCRYNNKSLGAVYLIPEKDTQTGIITLSSFSATVGPDDMLIPVGYEPPEEEI